MEAHSDEQTGSDSDHPELVEHVRDALTHLYDHVYLQRHPLARRLVPSDAVGVRTRAQELRRILLNAIEALNPGDRISVRAPERRPYAVLFGLYVEGREWREVADSLCVGGRQLRRDRTAALEAVTSILRDRHLDASIAESSSASKAPLRSEGERIAQFAVPVDLGDLVSELLPLLAPMADERRVQLLSNVAPDCPKLAVNRTLVRQILLHLASQALRRLPLVRLSLEVGVAQTEISIGLNLVYRSENGQVSGALAMLDLEPAETLASTLGARLLSGWSERGEEKVWVALPRRDRTLVLVVDDNRELFELFERYVAGHPYRLVHAPSVEEALALVHSTKPHIITLDLMMPERDGWELLQALRSDLCAVHIPVVLCSVLEEPELARSLGVQIVVNKPVEQADLLRALGEARALVLGEAARQE